MQSRRRFLCTAIRTATGATLSLVLAPLAGGCSTGTTPFPAPAPTPTTNPTLPGPACDGIGATSTLTLDHTHTICVPLADIRSPPPSGQTYTTSAASTDGHTHSITLSQPELTTLATGQTLIVTTTIVEAHTHDFALTEPVE